MKLRQGKNWEQELDDDQMCIPETEETRVEIKQYTADAVFPQKMNAAV